MIVRLINAGQGQCVLLRKYFAVDFFFFFGNVERMGERDIMITPSVQR